jgi:hypothetical protein
MAIRSVSLEAHDVVGDGPELVSRRRRIHPFGNVKPDVQVETVPFVDHQAQRVQQAIQRPDARPSRDDDEAQRDRFVAVGWLGRATEQSKNQEHACQKGYRQTNKPWAAAQVRLQSSLPFQVHVCLLSLINHQARQFVLRPFSTGCNPWHSFVLGSVPVNLQNAHKKTQ